VLKRNGRHEETRTPDLYRVKLVVITNTKTYKALAAIKVPVSRARTGIMCPYCALDALKANASRVEQIIYSDLPPSRREIAQPPDPARFLICLPTGNRGKSMGKRGQCLENLFHRPNCHRVISGRHRRRWADVCLRRRPVQARAGWNRVWSWHGDWGSELHGLAISLITGTFAHVQVVVEITPKKKGGRQKWRAAQEKTECSRR